MNIKLLLKNRTNTLIISGIVILFLLLISWFLWGHSTPDAAQTTPLAPKKAPTAKPTSPATQFRPAIHYSGTETTDPFQKQILEKTGSSNSPLLRYPVDALHLVGILKKGNEMWAIIATPDGKIYQVTVGDMLGNQQGIIKTINTQQVTLQETPPPDTGVISNRTVTLNLGR